MLLTAKSIYSNKEIIKSVFEKSTLCCTIFENTSEGILVTDRDGNIIMVNAAFAAITGYSRGEVIGKNPRFLKSGLNDARFYEQMWDSIKVIGQWQGEIVNRRKDGTTYPEMLNILSIRDQAGEPELFIGLFTDLTTHRDDDEFFKYVATHDHLTDLPNRSRFYDCLNRAVYQAKVNHQQLAVLFIDLDGFKSVNDRYGHEVGDQVLIEVANRLMSCVIEKDQVARMGGDEFTVILEDIAGPEEAAQMADRILAALAAPNILPDSEPEGQGRLTASIGISLYPGKLRDSEKLLSQADQAMYQTKELGKNGYKFFRQS